MKPTFPIIETQRLILRGPQESDLAPLTEMNADARVMEYFPAPLTPEESAAMISRINDHFVKHGYSYWIVEAPGEARFIGIAGLLVPDFEAHFTPCVEIGWRFAHGFWSNGYAGEAARALVDFGFERAGLHEIVSLTVPANVRSWRLMERLGMTRDPAEDFGHPGLPAGHPLRQHVLYRLSKADWIASR